MKKIFAYLFLTFIVLASAAFSGGLISAFTGLSLSAGFGIALAVSFIPRKQGVLYMAIPTVDATALYTKNLVAVYNEMTTVTGFLRSFFRTDLALTREVSIAVRRGTEKVAVDVKRFQEGNRNIFSHSDEKIFLPPMYWEYLEMTNHRLYEVVVGAIANGDGGNFFAGLVQEQARDFFELQKKIERAIEIQCAQVFDTGIVQLQNSANIDFKRKAASLVDKGSGNYWATGTISPYDDLENGANFLRQIGKAQGAVFNVLMGSEALRDFLSNTIVKERADILRYNLDTIDTPQRDAVGSSFHGEVSAGAYRFRIWTYPEFYDNSAGVSTAYINTKKAIILPENPSDFVVSYGLVPQLIDDNGTVPQNGEYLIQESRDTLQASHQMHIKAAPIAVPVSVDQIYTVQVVAS